MKPLHVRTSITAFCDMSGVLTVLICAVLVSHQLQLAAASDEDDDFQQTDTHTPRDGDVGDGDVSSPAESGGNSSPLEPTFDDSPDESLDEKPVQFSKSYWNRDSSDTPPEQSHEEPDTSTAAPQKNIFIYVPFRSQNSRLQRQEEVVRTTTTTTSTTTTTTPKPSLLRGHPTLRTTFSSAWPPEDSPSLRSISRSSQEYKRLEKWKPVSGLKESASSSFYTQAAVPIVQSPTQIVQSPSTLVLAPQQSFPPQQVLHQVQQVQAVQDVRVVEAQPQPQPPVQLSVVQSPAAAPPVHLNIVRAPPPQPPAIHVNFVRAPPQTFVQQPVLHAPVGQQRFIQAPPVHTHIVQSPVIHAHPVVHTPVLRAPFSQSSPVFASPVPPPCATPLFSPPVHAVPHTFFIPPQAQRTRTVLQQVQFVPEQTHVFSTTSYSPATRTTIYEADHVGAFSAPKGHYVRAPVHRSPVDFVADRESASTRSTIYTFPKMRILGAPVRIAGRLSSRRQLRQRLREEWRKERHKNDKEKKILVFNRRNSL